MSREIQRVPLDFAWPVGQVWEGYLTPGEFGEVPCAACSYDRAPSFMDLAFPAPASGTGLAPDAQHLHDQWYGTAGWDPAHNRLPFHPERYGSKLLTTDTPGVRAFAERNVGRSPEFYGAGERAIRREGERLCGLWNAQWAHHLNQADVDALVAAGRLMDFTHTWSREDGWVKIDPPVRPTAEQVNEWSLLGWGHDSINAGVCLRARCGREGFAINCPGCDGEGSNEAYPGQRAKRAQWRKEEPPMGEGWQLWETVTEGSPRSPVFASALELAGWMSDPERGEDWVPMDVAVNFIEAGSAPTFVGKDGHLASGVEAVGLRDPDD